VWIETETLPTDPDPDVEVAARILAVAQRRQDGWCPAEDLPMLLDGDLVGATLDFAPWARRLDELLRRRPAVTVAVDGGATYPRNLRYITGRPALLFLDATMQPDDDRAVAVVGSRRADDGAIEATTAIAMELVERNYTVVSGLARGIDTAAHKGALAAGGRTIAVVGTGIDEVFPPENGGFIDRIRAAGVIISQFPPGHGPTKTTFPARNAVIAGLSLGSLVVTASERSGTRIEIDRSLAQGRPVFLWEPLLGSQRWAQTLAAHDLVHLISSLDELDQVLGDMAS